MTKTEFLERIKSGLSDLTDAERERALEFCAEMIDDRIEDGMTEEDAIDSLGSVDELIAAIAKDMPRVPMSVENTVARMDDLCEVKSVFANMQGGDIYVKIAEDGVARAYFDGDSEYEKVEYKDGVLRLTQQMPIFAGFKRFFREKDANDAYIFLPRGSYEELELFSSAGDVSVSAGLHVGCVKIKSGAGNAEFFSDADSLDMVCNAGDAEIKNVTVTEKAFVKCSAGDADIESLSAKTGEIVLMAGDMRMSSCRFDSFSCSSSAGDIDITDVSVNGDAYIKSLAGDINADRFDADSIEATSSAGDILIRLRKKMNFDAKSTAGDVQVPVSDPSGGVCKIRSFAGDVEVTIA